MTIVPPAAVLIGSRIETSQSLAMRIVPPAFGWVEGSAKLVW
ncbi:MAG: hypothetical protein R3B97_05575 [Dehalococcoidia bacterium]